MHECEQRIDALQAAVDHDAAGNVTAEAEHFHRQVVPAMEQLRETADRMEVLLPDDLWPLPTYAEMLFIK